MEVFLKENASALGYKKEEGLEHNMRREGLAKVINSYPQYFTFTFVRNPFDRFVSVWKHSERAEGEYFNRPRKNLTLKEYACLIAEASPHSLSPFDKYHSRKQIDFILDFNKSYFFGVPRISNENCGLIGRFENLQTDFQKVCRLLNIPNCQLPFLQSSPEALQGNRPHYSSYYDPESLQMVREIYAEDIDRLGYHFEATTLSNDVT